MSDCLICLAPTRIKWTPEIPCTCLPTMHRRCWQRWVDRMGPICIICRTHENGPPRQIIIYRAAAEQPPPLPPPIPVPAFYRCYNRLIFTIELMFLILVFVLIFRIMAMHSIATQPQQHRPQFRAPGPIPWYPPLQPAAPHDEL